LLEVEVEDSVLVEVEERGDTELTQQQ